MSDQYLYGFSPDERRRFLELADRLAKLSIDPPAYAPIPSPNQSSDFYIVKTPTSGIPACSGTKPGSAYCDLYYVDDLTNPTTPALTAVYPGMSQTKVYNQNTSAIASSIYQSVSKDKYGRFWISGAVSGSKKYRGTLKNNLKHTDVACIVTNLVSYDGSTPPSQVDARNVYNFGGQAGAPALVELNKGGGEGTGTGSYPGTGASPGRGTYELIQLGHVAKSYVESITEGTNKLTYKYHNAIVMDEGGTGTGTNLPGTACG